MSGEFLTMFPRGDGPLVSVLLPTRGRPDLLETAVRSWVDSAADRTVAEFLLRVDDDDSETLCCADALRSDLQKDGVRVSIHSTPRGDGYLGLHRWYNEAALHHAVGDWCVLFNDDAEMLTRGWDRILAHFYLTGNPPAGVTDVCLAMFSVEDDPACYSYAAIRRSVAAVLGHLSLSPLADTWLFHVLSFADCHVRLPVAVRHQKGGRRDATRLDSDAAAVEADRMARSLATKRAMLVDVDKVLSHLERKARDAVWTPRPLGPGWHQWRPAPGAAAQTLLVIPASGPNGLMEALEVLGGGLLSKWVPDAGEWSRVY